MRSFRSVLPPLRAQWTQQKILSNCSTPWPMTRHWQWGQTGASAWIAHSKLSNVCRFPATVSSNDLSYSFSQTSHLAILRFFVCGGLFGGVRKAEIAQRSNIAWPSIKWGKDSKPNPTHLLPPAQPGALRFLRGRAVSECRSLVVLCKSP